MPKRIAIRRVESPEIQGEDSWVDLSCATLGEVLEARRRKDERKEKDEEENVFERNLAYLQKHVIAWNWADTNGTPLPQPSADLDVLLGLTLPEHTFLLDALFETKSEDEEKN